jgi:hypothetical protein
MAARCGAPELDWRMRFETDVAAGLTNMLDARPRLAPGVAMCTTRRWRGSSWDDESVRFDTAEPFVAHVTCPPWVASLVMRFDGSTTLRAAAHAARVDGPRGAWTDEDAASHLSQLLAHGVATLDAYPLPERGARPR